VASSKAVKALVSRGRKRGFGTILATQRLSKLDKDAAEAANTLTGQTVLDVDLERAGDALGFNRREYQQIEHLRPGWFFAKGRAFTDGGEVTLVRSTDSVRTKHPDGTAAIASVPLPSEIASALSQLRVEHDGPDENASRQELLEQITRLEAQLKAAKEGNSSDPADIRRAVEAAQAPLQRENMALQVKLERVLTQARMIILDAGELPPVAEPDYSSVYDPPVPIEDLRRVEAGIAAACLAWPKAGTVIADDPPMEPRMSQAEYDEWFAGVKERFLGDGRTAVLTPLTIATSEEADAAIAALTKKAYPPEALPDMRKHPTDVTEQLMLVTLRDCGEMESAELARRTGQSPTSSSFRAHRKHLADLGHADYPPDKRGWIRYREPGDL
jgi:hypothetical protein